MNQFIQWLADTFRGARFWFVVLPWERAVRVRLGKHARLYEAGWHWRVPFIDDLRTFNNRLRLTSFPSLTVTSKDGKTVTAAGLVGFRITDPLRALMVLQQPEATAAGLAMGEIAKYLSEKPYAECSASEAASAAAGAIANEMPGITVDFVRLVDYASIRTFRLLQEQWRPGTNTDAAL